MRLEGWHALSNDLQHQIASGAPTLQNISVSKHIVLACSDLSFTYVSQKSKTPLQSKCSSSVILYAVIMAYNRSLEPYSVLTYVLVDSIHCSSFSFKVNGSKIAMPTCDRYNPCLHCHCHKKCCKQA